LIKFHIFYSFLFIFFIFALNYKKTYNFFFFFCFFEILHVSKTFFLFLNVCLKPKLRKKSRFCTFYKLFEILHVCFFRLFHFCINKTLGKKSSFFYYFYLTVYYMTKNRKRCKKSLRALQGGVFLHGNLNGKKISLKGKKFP